MLRHALMHPLGVNRVRGVLQAVWPALAQIPVPYALSSKFDRALYIQPQDTPKTNATNLPVRIQFGIERTCSSQRQP